MEDRPYRICAKCIMDTTDPDIRFDDHGVCSHCRKYENHLQSRAYRLRREPGALERLVTEIQERGKGRKYDCIIGVSGGVDSTYTAYITKKIGLRPLAVHLDNGWDSELAVGNIKKTLKVLDIDLTTHVLDWEEFRDLQLSFLKASTPDSEIPTDHAIHTVLYQAAVREKTPYVLIGRNTATEGGGVPAWSQGHADWKYIKNIQKRFGSRRLETFPHYGLFHLLYYRVFKKIQMIPILDYVDYDKKQALGILENELGWKHYGAKHYESVYTRFFQGYILPKKFGFEKKRLHLSSLIWSGQMTRQEAFQEMEKEDYPPALREQEREYVIKKFQLTPEEFDGLMALAPKSFWDYPSSKRIIHRYRWLLSIYRRLQSP